MGWIWNSGCSWFDGALVEVAWHIGPTISAKYMGDDMTLLLGLSDKRAAEIIREETEQSSSPFYSLTKWSPQLRMGTRLIWCRCWGIPILGWKAEYIRQMVAAVGIIFGCK